MNIPNRVARKLVQLIHKSLYNSISHSPKGMKCCTVNYKKKYAKRQKKIVMIIFWQHRLRINIKGNMQEQTSPSNGAVLSFQRDPSNFSS